MTAATRKTPTVANGGSDVGTSYASAVDTEVGALWKAIPQWLTNVGGTANHITATTDSALVGPLLAYGRPNTFYLVPLSDNTAATDINIDTVGIFNVVDKDAGSLAAGALKAGRLHILINDGTQLRLYSSAPPSNPPTPAPDMIVQEQQASGTAAGGFTSGSFVTRALNTAVRNVIAGASLASNQITLPAGTYAVEWSAPAQSVGSHATRLFNVTDAAVIETGTSEVGASGTANIQSRSFGIAVFTLSSSKAIRLEHQCQTTRATNGLGVAGSLSAHEVYSWVNIWKTA